MSVNALHGGQLPSWLTVVREAAEAAGDVPLGAVPDDELGEALRAVVQAESQLRSLRLRLLRESDVRRSAEADAASDTAAWAAKLTGTTRGVMSGGLRLARLLEEKYDLTRQAFARGAINEKQVRVVVDAAEQMPPAATAEDRQVAEAGLLELAVDGMNARRLRQRARRMLERISRELADQQERDMLEREEDDAEQETWLTLGDRGDGTYAGKFVIPETQGRMLANFLERLTAPRRLVHNKAGEPVQDGTVDPTSPGGPNWSERLGLGFLELIEHLPAHGWTGSNTTMIVTVDLQHLRDGLGAAHLDTGQAMSAGQARRLACEAAIVPAVLGGPSEVLDLGRSMRLASTAIQRGIRLLHDTCAAEGCERPVAWCELHHAVPWSEGGATSLENTVPLCGHHHRRAHDQRYLTSTVEGGQIRFRLRRRRSAPTGDQPSWNGQWQVTRFPNGSTTVIPAPGTALSAQTPPTQRRGPERAEADGCIDPPPGTPGVPPPAMQRSLALYPA